MSSSFRYSGGLFGRLVLCAFFGAVGCEGSGGSGGPTSDAADTRDGATSDSASGNHADAAHDTASDAARDAAAPGDGAARDGETLDAPRDTSVDDQRAPDVSLDGGAPDVAMDGGVPPDGPLDGPGTGQPDGSLDGTGHADVSLDGYGPDAAAPDDASDDDPLPPDPCVDGAAFAHSTTPSNQSTCSSTMPCPAGMVCLGTMACDGVWSCLLHAQHPCPTEIFPYCGCDGVTFMSPFTCPDRPYDRIGACNDGFSCAPTRLLCPDEAEPPCPAGQVPTIVHGRYTTMCVPISSCRCEYAYECPHREKYECNLTTARCEPIPPDAGGQ